jgi:hypothetical protein
MKINAIKAAESENFFIMKTVKCKLNKWIQKEYLMKCKSNDLTET